MLLFVTRQLLVTVLSLFFYVSLRKVDAMALLTLELLVERWTKARLCVRAARQRPKR